MVQLQNAICGIGTGGGRTRRRQKHYGGQAPPELATETVALQGWVAFRCLRTPFRERPCRAGGRCSEEGVFGTAALRWWTPFNAFGRLMTPFGGGSEDQSRLQVGAPVAFLWRATSISNDQ